MTYQTPKIFADFLLVFKLYFKVHPNASKLFRVTIGEQILAEIATCLKNIVIINLRKENLIAHQLAIEKIKNIRASIEIIKCYFLIAWEIKAISHGFYGDIANRMIEISKQATKWQEWLSKQRPN